MPITIIPAQDWSGANQGLQIWAAALERRARFRQEQAKNAADFTDALTKMSPEEQSAKLSGIAASPELAAAFQEHTGVPVDAWRKAVIPGTPAQGIDYPQARPAGAPPAMLDPNAGGSGLVPAPALPPQRAFTAQPSVEAQQAKAALDATQQGIRTSAAQAGVANATALELAASTERINAEAKNIEAAQRTRDNAVALDFMRTMQYPDGRPVSRSDVDKIQAGQDIGPVRPRGPLDEVVAAYSSVLGGDPSNPGVAYAATKLATEARTGVINNEATQANIEYTQKNTELLGLEIQNLRAGMTKDGRNIGPALGKMTADASEGFNAAFDKAVGGFEAPTQIKTGMSFRAMLAGMAAFAATGTGGGIGAGLGGETSSPEVAKLIFASPDTNPDNIRKEIAAITGGGTLKKITFPVRDSSGIIVMQDLSADQAVAQIAAIRSRLSREMPGQFNALAQMDPHALYEVIATNHIVEQLAKYYNKPFYDHVQKLKKKFATDSESAARLTNPNTGLLEKALAEDTAAKARLDARQKMVQDLLREKASGQSPDAADYNTSAQIGQY